MNWTPPIFEHSAEAILATLAQMCAQQGDAAGVAVCALGAPTVEYENSNFNESCFELSVQVAPHLYASLEASRDDIEQRMCRLASRIGSNNQFIGSVRIRPRVVEAEGWRDEAKKWLRGEGINNQGRVRSDNIASRQHDGLLFRSAPEIEVYKVLKARGVAFAPLAVFVRGGDAYQRIEPDFVLLHLGVLAVVEVDGDTVHTESPAEAQQRTRLLEDEGVKVYRVAASKVSTTAGATAFVSELLGRIEKAARISR